MEYLLNGICCGTFGENPDLLIGLEGQPGAQIYIV